MGDMHFDHAMKLVPATNGWSVQYKGKNTVFYSREEFFKWMEDMMKVIEWEIAQEKKS